MSGYDFDAFLSYSHHAGRELAPLLQERIQGFAKPFYRRRALRVFRDRTNLSVSPELWPEIEQSIRSASAFILLASPEAARSGWVRRELETWLATSRVSRLFIVVTAGQVAWDASRNDFDWEATTALPRVLQGAFPSEPLYLDLRWAEGSDSLRDDARLLEATAILAAAVRGVPTDALWGEDLRQHRRTRRVIAAACMLLAGLTAAALFQTWQASRRASDLLVEKARQDLQTGEPHEAAKALEDAWSGPVASFLRGEASTRIARSVAEEIEAECVEFDPGGERLLALAWNQQPYLWSLGGHKLSFAVDAPDPTCGDVGPDWFSPAGTRIALIDQEGRAGIYRTDDGAMTGDLVTDGTAVERVAFSPDGRFLSVIANGQGGIWSALPPYGDGIVVHQLSARLGSASRIAWAPDASRVLTLTPDDRVLSWSLARRGGSQELTAGAGTLGVGISGSSSRALTYGDRGAFLWDLSSGRPIGSLPGTFVAGAIDREGDAIAVVSRQGHVSVYGVGEPIEGCEPEVDESVDCMRLRRLAQFEAELPPWKRDEGESSFEVSFDPKGERILVSGQPATLWSSLSGTKLARFGEDDVPYETSSVRWSRDGRRIALTRMIHSGSRLFMGSVLEVPPTRLRHEMRARAARFSPTEDVLAIATEKGVELRDTERFRPIPPIELDPTHRHIGVSSGSPRVVVGGGDRASVWDLRTREVIARIVVEGETESLESVGIDEAGRRVLTRGSAVQAWDAATGRWLGGIPVLPWIGSSWFDVSGAVLSATGTMTNGTGELHRWIERHEISPEPREPSGEVPDDEQIRSGWGIDFDADGDGVATDHAGRATDVVRLEDGATLATLVGHTEVVHSARWSPDRSLVVTAGDDWTAKVWDATTGALLSSLDAHRGPVRFAEFDRQGRWILTVGADGWVRIWAVDPVRDPLAAPPTDLAAERAKEEALYDDVAYRRAEAERAQARADELVELPWPEGMARKIAERWILAPGLRERPLETRVCTSIQADGTMGDAPHVVRQSGNSWFDGSAVRAVQAAFPLPPRPALEVLQVDMASPGTVRVVSDCAP